MIGSSGRRRARAAAAGAAVLVLAVLSSNCGSTRLAPVRYPDAVRYSAASDSLGLDAFRALPSAFQEARRLQAGLYFREVSDDISLDVRLRFLHNAAGLAPDVAPVWLALLHHARWFGDYQLAQSCLDGLQRAFAAAPGPGNRGLRRRAAETMAWVCYDRGTWVDGLAWVDSVQALGQDAPLIRGLLLAGSGQYLYAEDVARRVAGHDESSSSARWIHGVARWYRGSPELARSIFQLRQDLAFGVEPQSGPDAFIPGELRPEPGHAAECWRDLGMLEETLENWNEARAHYLRAFAGVSGADSRGVVRIDRRNLGAGRGELPVWLAFDRYFVTGSLSAYTALAYDRYAAASDPQTREFWASAAIDAAGTCVRREVDTPWALRVRGLLQVASGRTSEGRSDLEDAWRQLRQRRRADFATAATLGHLYLKENKPEAAVPLLQAALRLRPEAAEVWADLGLALILTGKFEAARPALDRALELDPDLAVGWYNRGLLYYHSGQWDAAVADLERAAALAPADRDIARVLDQARNWQRRGAGTPR